MGRADVARRALHRRPQRGDARVRGARRRGRAARRRRRALTLHVRRRASTGSCGASPMKDGQGLIGWAMRRQRGAPHERRARRPAPRRPTLDEHRRLRRATRRSPSRSKARSGEADGRHRALQQARLRGASPRRTARSSSSSRANASTAIRLQLSREAREREERLTTIGRLLSGVIHDLKTPLTVISGYVQLMQQADEQRAARRVRRARAASSSITSARCSARCSSSRAARRASSSARCTSQKFFERRARSSSSRSSRAAASSSWSICRTRAPRASTRARSRASSTTSRATPPRRWATRAASSPSRSRARRTPTDDALVMTFSDTGPGHPEGDRAPPLPVVRHERQEGRHRASASPS